MLEDARPAPAREPRTRPLPVLVGGNEVILLAEEVNALIESVDKLVASTYESIERAGQRHLHEIAQRSIDELEALADVLTGYGGRFGDPPLELDGDRSRVLRKVLADFDGYQRRELTAGLRELRAFLAATA
jgi:hypothetical protein